MCYVIVFTRFNVLDNRNFKRKVKQRNSNKKGTFILCIVVEILQIFFVCVSLHSVTTSGPVTGECQHRAADCWVQAAEGGRQHHQPGGVPGQVGGGHRPSHSQPRSDSVSKLCNWSIEKYSLEFCYIYIDIENSYIWQKFDIWYF